MQEVVEQAPRSEWIDGRQAMQTPEDVQAMLKLASLGWGAKRISREPGFRRRRTQAAAQSTAPPAPEMPACSGDRPDRRRTARPLP